jgi:hypothetical protein
LQGWGPAFAVGSVFFFYFAGSRCCTHNSTCASVVHRFRVSFDAIISFSIPSLLFSVCSLQVRMFSYFYWHARHMFLVPSVLRLQFGNRWRYICCLLVRWLLLVHWFVGSSVVACCCLAQVYEFGALGLQLGMFVLSRWFGACCFLLFTSALQGWGPAPTVGAVFFFFWGALRCSGPAPASGPAVVLFVVSGEVEIWRLFRARLFCCKILLILQC